MNQVDPGVQLLTEACERFFRRHPTDLVEVIEAFDLPFTPEKQLALYEVLRARILSYPYESLSSDDGSVEKRSQFGTVTEWPTGGVRAGKHIPHTDGLPYHVAGRIGEAGFQVAYRGGADITSTVYGTLIRLRSFPAGGLRPSDPLRPINTDFRVEHHHARGGLPERVVFKSAYGHGCYLPVFELDALPTVFELGALPTVFELDALPTVGTR